MSLKAFHVLFIAVSTLMALGVALWAANAWNATEEVAWLALAAAGFAGSAGLVVYGSRFIRKARQIGLAAFAFAASLGLPAEALACPACVGITDSPLQDGMNMGILVLLGLTGFMLSCFAYFFVRLALRARHAPGLHPRKGSV
ncbi:MAG: hypothetical protein FJW23_07345 [Acidimicrobiia bacterium]|nr:hypothetical protein [Acidimicrobiia bacterium]